MKCQSLGATVCNNQQALTINEKLHSQLSEPLVVTWPGVSAPALELASSTTGDVIKVKWTQPQCAEDMVIKHYKVRPELTKDMIVLLNVDNNIFFLQSNNKLHCTSGNMKYFTVYYFELQQT